MLSWRYSGVVVGNRNTRLIKELIYLLPKVFQDVYGGVLFTV